MTSRLNAAAQYLLARFREASTYRGIILVGTALFGWNVSEEKVAAVSIIGLGLAGLVGVVFPDKPQQ